MLYRSSTTTRQQRAKEPRYARKARHTVAPRRVHSVENAARIIHENHVAIFFPFEKTNVKVGPLAQLVARGIPDPKVAGSSPTRAYFFFASHGVSGYMCYYINM